MEKRRILTKTFAIIISIIVLVGLILSGPAEAYNLQLTSSSSNVEKNEKVSFIASVDIDSNEFLDIDYLVFDLNGNSSFQCKFAFDGTIISGCNGITIQQISSANFGYGYSYGYGYGYTNGELIYNITLDSTNYPAGIYKTSFSASVKGDIKIQNGTDLTIISLPSVPLKDCSIRAKDSAIYLKTISINKSFENSKINFFVPLKNAVPGTGYLTGQKNRQTFEYKFVIDRVLENNQNKLVVSVSGNYIIGTGKKVMQNSVITLDKKKNKVSLNGASVNIDGMGVYFREGC